MWARAPYHAAVACARGTWSDFRAVRNRRGELVTHEDVLRAVLIQESMGTAHSVRDRSAAAGRLSGFRRRGSRGVGPCPIHGGDNPIAFTWTPPPGKMGTPLMIWSRSGRTSPWKRAQTC